MLVQEHFIICHCSKKSKNNVTLPRYTHMIVLKITLQIVFSLLIFDQYYWRRLKIHEQYDYFRHDIL